MRPENFDIILWDFDGVIIESNSIRVNGFKEVLQSYPKNQVKELLNFHSRNGGLSRYVKFKYFFNQIRNEKISEKKISSLAMEFSKIMRNKLTQESLLIPEIMRFINDQHKAGKEMHIVSGSDHAELNFLCAKLKIEKYFKTISGSPTPKTELVSEIIENSEYSKSQFCLIGDSFNDFEAASNNGVIFFGYNNEDLVHLGNYLKL